MDIDELQRNLDRAVDERLARIQRIREFLSNCDEQDVAFLCSVLSNGAWPNQTLRGASLSNGRDGEAETAKETGVSKHLPQDTPILVLPEYGPTTYRGTERQRTWNILRPAVNQSIASMDEITSRSVYDFLMAASFKFETDRPISSIAAVLRKLKVDGVLIEAEVYKGGSHSPKYRKSGAIPGPKKKLQPGSRNAEVKKAISILSGIFTVSQVVQKLLASGFKFRAESPAVAVNGALRPLIKSGEIKLIKKGAGSMPSEYERTQKWRAD